MVSGTRLVLQSVGFLAVEKAIPEVFLRASFAGTCETADQVVEK
jgi:hypothetical protein